MRGLLVLVCFEFLLLGASPAAAHKVIASVFPGDTSIEGEIGLSNGEMAENVLVEVFDEAGAKLGETRTDEDGFFTFKPTRAGTHVFRANLGAGHVAEARMLAEEVAVLIGATPAGANLGMDAHAAAPPGAEAVLTDAQRQLITEVVRQEMTGLRREIAAYREERDLQSILGGIGYILGLFGIGFYFAARARLKG